jgi:hypothetical protein
MKKDKLFIAVPIIIIITLVGIIGFQLAKSQFGSSDSKTPTGPSKSMGNGGEGKGGSVKGPAPGAPEPTPPPGQ